MEMSCFGYLEMFFAKRNLNQEQELELMTGIAKGIEYLHSKDIIHRDIKPGNIVISDGHPIHVKLTDFDLCRILDENYDTSLMTSNVGTPMFKAPEFYRRTKEGKINYHRNVDIFAAGVTFLAIIQAEPKS